MNTCYIVGAMDCRPDFSPDETDTVIAADRGYDTLCRAGIKPDCVLGDFDSLGHAPEGENVVTYPREKDDTDTLLAVKLGLSRGYRDFRLYGCLGGRLDHTLANVQTLCYLAERGAKGVLVDEGMTVTVIKDSALSLPAREEGTVSVFAVCGKACGVRISGLKYELENAELSPDFPLGVSNEFIGNAAEISVRSGFLAVIAFDKKC